MIRRIVKYVVLALVVALVAVQLVPYGRDHDNLPVTAEPEWDTAETRALAVRVCFDCHSNEVHWPWYSNIAPLSWWVQDHVDEGREDLNFSEWSWSSHDIDEIAESVMDGEMPPNYYTIVPGSRQLNDSEMDLLIRGLVSTFNNSDQRQSDSGDGHDENDDDHDDDDDDHDD